MKWHLASHRLCAYCVYIHLCWRFRRAHAGRALVAKCRMDNGDVFTLGTHKNIYCTPFVGQKRRRTTQFIMRWLQRRRLRWCLPSQGSVSIFARGTMNYRISNWSHSRWLWSMPCTAHTRKATNAIDKSGTHMWAYIERYKIDSNVWWVTIKTGGAVVAWRKNKKQMDKLYMYMYFFFCTFVGVLYAKANFYGDSTLR